jgi:folate-binding Fe-S cluster repair protein YgfZ
MRVLKVSGKDSEDFLHRVTSGTVKGLKAGEGAGGALLNGQSKMIAQFDLIRTEEGFLLVSPRECFAALQAGLEKLHFAEDLEITEGLHFANLRKHAHGPRPQKFSLEHGIQWPSAVPGYLCFLSKEEQAPPADFDFDRIGAVVPSPKDWDTTTPALEAGMLPFIDRFKGCYPGQEVVELSLNVGHPVRVLRAFEGSEEFPSGAKVGLEGGGEGTVTSSARKGDSVRMLVRVLWAKREANLPGFRALGSDLT